MFIYKINPDTRDIGLNQRFYNTHQPFLLQGIDHSIKGITKLLAKLGSIMPTDDVADDIADRWKYETTHTYTLTIGITVRVPMSY